MLTFASRKTKDSELNKTSIASYLLYNFLENAILISWYHSQIFVQQHTTRRRAAGGDARRLVLKTRQKVTLLLINTPYHGRLLMAWKQNTIR
jgi:hypothetical protein